MSAKAKENYVLFESDSGDDDDQEIQSENENENENESQDEDEGDSNFNVLSNIIQENQNYQKLKVNRIEFGFEGVRPGPERKQSVNKAIGGGGPNRKRKSQINGPSPTQTPRKRSKQSSSNKNAAAATATATSSSSSLAPSVGHDENRDGVVGVEPTTSSKWKCYKSSKTQHLQQYYEFKTPDEAKKVKAKCKLCSNTVCGTAGNNSNFLSHLKYVSITVFIHGNVKRLIFFLI